MKKDELVNAVKEGIKTEEFATAVYLEHLDAIVLRSGLPSGEIADLKNNIEFLILKNKEHKERLAGLLRKIEQENKSVY